MKHKRSVMSIAMAAIMLLSLCAVVSTSVSAAPSNSRASVQTTPDLVGSPIAAGTGPAACVLKGSTNLYVFVKGNDSALWYRIWSTTSYAWTGSWVSLGGQLGSSPCAVSREEGIIDVYVTGIPYEGFNYAVVYEKAFYAGAWHNWYLVGGKVLPGTGPAASGWPGREDVFVTGTSQNLYQTTWGLQGPVFSNWVNLGGNLTSSPAAVSRGVNLIDVHARGVNGADWYRAYVSGWSAWATLGGGIASGTGPALSAWGTDREDVFVTGTNGALYVKTWNAGSGWTGWASLGGFITASPTATTYTFESAIDIAAWVRGGNGLLYLKEYYGRAWWSWRGPYQGPP